MNPKRLRVLIVVPTLNRVGGATQYAYEIGRGLDPERFEIAYLVRHRIKPDEEYYCRLKERGHSFYYYRDDHPPLTRPARETLEAADPASAQDAAVPAAGGALGGWKAKIGGRLRGTWIEKLVKWPRRVRLDRAWRKFFDGFDRVAFIHLDLYRRYQSVLPQDGRVILHSLINRYQFDESPYLGCDLNRDYRLIFCFRDQAAESAPLDRARSAKSWFAPLLFDSSWVPAADITFGPGPDGVLHLAFFSRPQPDRPLMPLLECVALLHQRLPVHLHWFGWGDPEPWKPALARLGIEDITTFEGHAADMARALEERHICLVLGTISWITGGYADLELHHMGVPAAYFDCGFFSKAEDPAYTSGATMIHDDVQAFASSCEQVLKDPGRLRALARSQKELAVARHNTGEALAVIERAYLDPDSGEPLPAQRPEHVFQSLRRRFMASA